MPFCVLSRRAALAALGGGLIAASAPAFAQANFRLRAIRVDVSKLRASSLDPTAAWVEQALPGELGKAFAAWMAPSGREGATLTARIDSVFLATPSPSLLGDRAVDEIEGAAVVAGARGAIAAETPLRATATYRPSSVDAVLWEESNHRRVIMLAKVFAYWLPREMGL